MSGSVFRSAFAVLRGNRGVVCALILAASVLQAVVGGAPYLVAVGSRVVDASIGSVSIVVVLDPLASQSDADALGPLIRATPGIAAASFRSKDDAVRSLVATGLPPPEGRNPLPDVWVARIDSAAAGPDRSVAAVVADARRALAGLPHVESATTDDGWVRFAEQTTARWRKVRPLVWIAIVALASLLLGCVAFLAGGGLAKASPESRSMRILGIVGLLAGTVSGLIGHAIDWLIVAQWNAAPVAVLQRSFGRVLFDQLGATLGTFVLAVLILMGGLCFGGRSRT